NLPDIADKYAERRQEPGEAHRNKHQWEQDKREQNCRPLELMIQDQLRQQQYANAYDSMKQSGTKRDPWKYFQRENDLFHIVDVGKCQCRVAIDAFREESMHDQSNEKNDRKIRLAFRASYPPPCLENHREHERINHEHKQGIKKRPCDPHD